MLIAITTNIRVIDVEQVLNAATDAGRAGGRDDDWEPETVEEAIEELEIWQDGSPVNNGYEVLSREVTLENGLYDSAELKDRILGKIAEARAMPESVDMRRSVFIAKRHDGITHVGANYQPAIAEVGERFSYDHGVGSSKNLDALIVWKE